ncbi:MAG: hypothetical protein WAN74_07515 [Thermoplasmata archaeon]
MAGRRKWGYVSAGDSAIWLGTRGVEIEITGDAKNKTAEAKVGTVYIGKAGIKRKPKGKRVPGATISWGSLDRLYGGWKIKP